jgi:hypothetical protein
LAASGRENNSTDASAKPVQARTRLHGCQEAVITGDYFAARGDERPFHNPGGRWDIAFIAADDFHLYTLEFSGHEVFP